MNSDDQNQNVATRGPNYDWKHEARHYQDECEKLRDLLHRVERSGDKAAEERDEALNALTFTQEEWLLRTKRLEIENYELRHTLLSIVSDFPDTRAGLMAKEALENK